MYDSDNELRRRGCVRVTASAAPLPSWGTSGVAWNVLDAELCTTAHALAEANPSCTVHSDALCAIAARQSSLSAKTKDEGDEVLPLLVHAPVFARCTRPSLSLFDVVLPRLTHHDRDAAARKDELQPQGTRPLGSDLAACVQAALGVALCAHVGTDDAASSSGTSSQLHDAAVLVAHSVVRLLAPATLAPSITLGLTMSPAPDHVTHPDACERLTRLHWSYLESSAAVPVDYDALAAHWEAAVGASTALRRRVSHVDVPSPSTHTRAEAAHSCWAAPDTQAADSASVHRRLHAYAERVAASELLSCCASLPFSGSPPRWRSALLAILLDVRQRLVEQETGGNALSLLHGTAQHDALAQWLLQWFSFLACRSAPTSCAGSVTDAPPRHASPCAQLPIDIQTQLHAALHSSTGLRAALTSLPVGCGSGGSNSSSPLHPLRDALQHVAHWLTLHVLEATLAQLPATLSVGQSATSCSPPPFADAHVLFRSSCGQEGVVQSARTTHVRRGGGLTQVRPSRWMIYHNAGAVRRSLLELTPAQSAFVSLLERLLDVAAQRSADPIATVRRSPPSSLLTYDLFTQPELHGVAVCRLRCAVGPQQSSNAPLAPPSQRRASVARSTVPHGSSGSGGGNNNITAAAVVRAPLVACLLAWFAADFDCVFSALHRVWCLALRYGSATASTSVSEEAATATFSSLWRGLVNPSVRCDAAAAAGVPALGLLGRCLLLAMWMSLSVVDADEGPREGAATAPPSRRRAMAAWAGTIAYSSRRNVLHVRDWATAMHLARVANALCVGVRRPVRPHGDTDAGCSEQRERVEAAVAAVVTAFLNARASAVRRHERWRAALLHTRPRPLPEAGAPATAAEHGDEVEDTEEACVLLTWSCTRGPASHAPASPPPSPSLDFSVEEVVESMSEGEAPAKISHGNTSSSTVLATNTAAPLIDLEVRLRGLLTRDALADGLWLLRMAERLARHAWEESEAAARQGMTTAYTHHTMKAEKAPVCGGESSAAAREEKHRASSPVAVAVLHADEREPSWLPPRPSSSSSFYAAGVAAPAAASPLPPSLAHAYLCEDEAANRSSLRGVEQRQRRLLHRQCGNGAAQVTLQRVEMERRALLRCMWAVQEAEWQARWRAVVVPECVLRALLAEYAAAAVETARQRGRARTPPEQRRPASPLRPVTIAREAHAHRAFLLGSEVKGPSAPATPTAARPTRAAAPAARSLSPMQPTSRAGSLKRAERAPTQRARTSPPPRSPTPQQRAAPPCCVSRPQRSRTRRSSPPPPRSPPCGKRGDSATVPVIRFSLCTSSSCTPAAQQQQQQQPSPHTAAPSPSPLTDLSLNHIGPMARESPQRAADSTCTPPTSPPPPLAAASSAWWCPVEEGGRSHAPSPADPLRVLRRQHRRLRPRRTTSHAGGGGGVPVALAVAEAVRIATAAAAAPTTAEPSPRTDMHPIARTAGLPLDVAFADASRGKVRRSTSATSRASPASASNAPALDALHVLPRRRRPSVVTWAEDVEEY